MPRFEDRREGRGPARDPSISRIITPAPLSNVTWARIRSSPLLLLQNGYSRATAFGTRVFLQGLTVAVYSSLFDRSKSKRMDPSQGEESKRKTHIYIYTHQERASIRGGSHVPVQIVTSLTVTSVTDYRYGSPSLSFPLLARALFGYLLARSSSDL